MGTRPMSDSPEASFAAQTEGVDQESSYRLESSCWAGGCSKFHMRGAGFRKEMAAMRSFTP